MTNSQTLAPAYLTCAQAADYLNCSTRTISRMTSLGELRCHRIGRLVRYRSADLDAVAIASDTWK